MALLYHVRSAQTGITARMWALSAITLSITSLYRLKGGFTHSLSCLQAILKASVPYGDPGPHHLGNRAVRTSENASTVGWNANFSHTTFTNSSLTAYFSVSQSSGGLRHSSWLPTSPPASRQGGVQFNHKWVTIHIKRAFLNCITPVVAPA